MKFRNKIITLGSIAAAIAVMLAAALALNIDPTPRPDVLTQPPLEELYSSEDITVYANSLDFTTVYHVSPNCRYLFESTMQEMSEREAVALGLNPCGLCISLSCPGHNGDEIEFVYYAQGAKYFHKQEECSGGRMPLKAAYADLITEYPEKEPCPMCLPEGIVLCLHGRAFLIEPAPDPTATPEPEEMQGGEEKAPAPEAEEYASVSADTKKETTQGNADAVYTEYGSNLTTYHRLPDCAGGDYRRQISEMQANREKLQPCEACYFGYVFYNENGVYYHSAKHCQGMMNAKQHSRKDARSDGKFPCPLCLNVYSTKSGKYFHLLPDCIGMLGAELRSLEEAYALGQTRCPVCLSPETVYCTPKGAYFHAEQSCSGMEGAQPIDPEDAWNMDKDPCPVCITGRAHAMLSQQEDNSMAVAAPEYEHLFVQAFGKGINDLFPGYSYDQTIVTDDPDWGNFQIWMLKSDTNPEGEQLQGGFLFGKNEVYDCYWMLVNLSDNFLGEGKDNIQSFFKDASVCKDGRDIPLFDLQNYALVHSEAKKVNPDADLSRFSIAGVKVHFDWEDQVSGYDVRYLYDGKNACIRRIWFGEDGTLKNQIMECEDWLTL